MRVVGLDLAGSQRNDTGWCLLAETGGVKAVACRIVHSDDEILSGLRDARPDIVAVDAPLTYSGARRACDEALREYGALPVTLRGMEILAERGRSLAEKMRVGGLRFIEVHSQASAKILGVYHKNDFTMQKNMMALDLAGDVNTKILSRDELDAVMAAVTGYLSLFSQTREVGDDAGRVVVPNV